MNQLGLMGWGLACQTVQIQMIPVPTIIIILAQPDGKN